MWFIHEKKFQNNFPPCNLQTKKSTIDTQLSKILIKNNQHIICEVRMRFKKWIYIKTNAIFWCSEGQIPNLTMIVLLLSLLSAHSRKKIKTHLTLNHVKIITIFHLKIIQQEQKHGSYLIQWWSCSREPTEITLFHTFFHLQKRFWFSHVKILKLVSPH